MADGTAIEWTEATWNPITGCSVISPGCANCYAMRLAGTRLAQHASRAGLTQPSKAGPVWTGEVRLNEGWLEQPIKWHKPRRIFVCAHGDLFHDAVPFHWIDRVFRVMRSAPRHSFQVLTKRANRMFHYMTPGAGHLRWPGHLPNVWLGVSVEDQRCAQHRLRYLVECPAVVRWVSAEPLLGPLDLTPWLDRLDWVVAGGESGPGARPMRAEWVRHLRDQCRAAGVAFYFKQWGGARPKSGGRLLDGRTWDEYPDGR